MRALVVLLALALAAPAAADDLAAAIAAGAGAGLPDDLAVLDVHVPRALARRHRAATDVAVEWPRAPKVGRVSVRVRIAGRAVGFVPVTVAARASVFVATQALPAGHLITVDDVVVSREVVAPGLRPAEVAIGTITTAALAAGDVIDRARVTRPPPVARDTDVAVEVQAGAVTIRTHGRLAASARPGEPAVVRLDAGPQLRGTLVDDHRVVVTQELP